MEVGRLSATGEVVIAEKGKSLAAISLGSLQSWREAMKFSCSGVKVILLGEEDEGEAIGED